MKNNHNKLYGVYNPMDNEYVGLYKTIEEAEEQAFHMFCDSEQIPTSVRHLIDKSIAKLEMVYTIEAVDLMDIASQINAWGVK